MLKLTCSVDHCVNNEDNCCCRPDILVKGDKALENEETFCSSYTRRSNRSINSKMYKHPEYETKVYCEAEYCIYNDDRICTVGYIHIDNNHYYRKYNTMCGSYDARFNAFSQ